MSRSDVTRTTTRCPSGRAILGGRACGRVERLLLLRCRLTKLLDRGLISHFNFYCRRVRLLEASLAAEGWDPARSRELVGGAA